MPVPQLVNLTDADGARAVVAPELGGWLLRYARELPPHGAVEAMHFDQAVVDRYPRELYTGNPLLFPLVSFNHLPDADHHYEWQGRRYQMLQHGFARHCSWAVVDQSADALTMELRDTEATRAHYPFAFCHRLSYRLHAGRLHGEQSVTNLGPDAMPFSTGIHPYFAVPFTPRGRRAECFVTVPDCRRLTMHGRGEHFTAKPFPAQNWSVSEDVSAALFLAGLRQRELALVDPGSELEVVLNWEGAPQHRFVAFWSRSTTEPFYCLEPWTALSNAFTRAKDHELVLLDSGQTFEAVFWLELRPLA
jgi:aldose 1-epimerase